MKEQFNPFAYLANLVDPGQYTERPLRTPQQGDTGTITPIQRKALYGVPADLLQAAHNLTIRNPNEMTGAEFVSQMAGIPALAKTLDRLSGGFQLHSGSGQATQMLPETRDALLAVAPFAAKPAVAATRAAIRGVKAAEDATIGGLQRARIGRAAEQALQTPESTYAPLRERMENQGNLQLAVKPKGGNWRPEVTGISDDITKATRPLIQRGPTTRDEAIAEGGPWRLQLNEHGDWETLADQPEGQAIMANTAALNRWLNKKLTPYIRNELGTPDDPIRILHDQDITHKPGYRNMHEHLSDDIVENRLRAGFPEAGYANTRLGRNWEILADFHLNSENARRSQSKAATAKEFDRPGHPPPAEYQYYADLLEQNPWLAKADPNTQLYTLHMPEDFADDLGFRHLMDELRASLSPNSELPAHLRLTPDTLNKVSVADAVKRVDEINSWRLHEAEKAERAGMLENLNSNARLADPTAQLSFVDKPGMTWVDIPEVVNAKGTKLCTDIGRQGGWCTMNADTAKEYGSGSSRLVALLDAEGRPHAQAMILKSSKSPYDEWFDKNGGDVKAPEVAEFLAWVEARAKAGGSKMNANQMYLEWAAETGRSIVPPAQNIQELKPPGNAFSSDRSNVYKKRDPDYQKKVSESVVKFLNSGEWGEVNDLYHYGITDVRDKNSWLRVLQRVSPERDIEKAMDNFSSVLSSNPDLPRFMTDKDIAQLLGAPPAEGYAEGGAVKSDFFIDPSSYAQSRSKQMFPKQKSEWTQQDAARHMLASGMMAQKFGPTVAKIAGLAHEHGNAPVKTIGYMLGIGKMPPDYDQDLHNNALGVQLGKEAKSQEDLESRIQAILGNAAKQPMPGQPWIGRPNIPNQMSDYAQGGMVKPYSTNPFDHLV